MVNPVPNIPVAAPGFLTGLSILLVQEQPVLKDSETLKPRYSCGFSLKPMKNKRVIRSVSLKHKLTTKLFSLQSGS